MLDTRPRTLKTERELYKRSAVRSPTQSCLLQERGGSAHTGPSTVDGQGGEGSGGAPDHESLPLVHACVRCRPAPSMQWEHWSPPRRRFPSLSARTSMQRENSTRGPLFSLSASVCSSSKQARKAGRQADSAIFVCVLLLKLIQIAAAAGCFSPLKLS